MSEEIPDVVERTGSLFRHVEELRPPKEVPSQSGREMTAGLPGPEFWADAPWRLEPDTSEIPFTFILRDFKGALNEIEVYEDVDGNWKPVHTFDGPGQIKEKFWVDRHKLPIAGTFDTAEIGNPLHLNIIFRGSLDPATPSIENIHEQCLLIFWAKESLPWRTSPNWHYGDTHYHSDYTNDIREFGGPLEDTKEAGRLIGLDWLIVTDHSVDIDSMNPYFVGNNQEPDARWNAMQREVGNFSSDEFRILQGIEVTVKGKPGRLDDTLHMLVFGSENPESKFKLMNFIPGAWSDARILKEILQMLKFLQRKDIGYLFGKIYGLSEVLTGKNDRDQAIENLSERSVQAQGALAFAAHPTTIAQGPGGTWEDRDLQHTGINGMQAWNTRYRYRDTKQGCLHESKPKKSKSSLDKTRKAIERWNEMLIRRIDAGISPRFVLIAGSDAHGSFNHSIAWVLDLDGIFTDDNCVGKVRTALYLPSRNENDHHAPTEEEIVEALKTGRCVATDGPMVSFTARSESLEGQPFATLGSVMDIGTDKLLEIEVEGHSIAEFGQLEHVDIVHYSKGMNKDDHVPQRLARGSSELEIETKSDQGYIRLETETLKGNDTYHCYTNPIWFEGTSDGPLTIKVAWKDA